jgi:hypothetical protein
MAIKYLISNKFLPKIKRFSKFIYEKSSLGSVLCNAITTELNCLKVLYEWLSREVYYLYIEMRKTHSKFCFKKKNKKTLICQNFN